MTRTRALLTSLVSILIGGAVIAAAGFVLARASAPQEELVAQRVGTSSIVVDGQRRTVNHEALTISAYPDALFGDVLGGENGAHPDWVAYSNNNLVVHANSLVTITVKQYDGGEVLNNSYFGNVVGTIDGTATVDGKKITSWSPEHVGHTFTLRGIPGSGRNIFVSVPIPANDEVDLCDPAEENPEICAYQGAGYYPKKAVEVTFSFYVGEAGQYQWNCEYPCGGTRIGQFGNAMSTWGYMSGTLTVK
jgi:hypothetical protein